MRTQPRVVLTRSAIVDAGVDLLDGAGGDGLTMRRLGEALDVDATAVYRHFRDKSELMRAIADRLLVAVTAELDEDEWRDTVITICLRLREALLRHPRLAAAVRDAPPLGTGEFAITETLLRQFLHAGLGPHDAALAYHSVIELAVGSATIDATVNALDDADRERAYDRWRHAYAALPADEYPASRAVADQLYRGTAADRFTVALGRLLDGIAAQAPY